jgi:hypothetical protein
LYVVYSHSRTPAREPEDDMELTAPPVSAKSNSRSKSNSDGLPLTKSGSVSMISKEVNAKYDASNRSSDNTNKLLRRNLRIGQACRLIGVALYGADIPLEDSGIYFSYFFAYSTYFGYFAYFRFTLIVFIL